MEQPIPDHKNWTWVLERTCPECGLDVSSIERDTIGRRIRANASAWRAALGRGDLVPVRPPSGAARGPVWSALEYGAHVRDVYELFGERLERLLREDDPTFGDRDLNQLAIDNRYHLEDPGRVGYQLAVEAGKVADMLDRVSGTGWQRAGSRSDGVTFTVESLARYLLHDVVHHLWDVEQGYEAITEAQAPADEGEGADEAGARDGDGHDWNGDDDWDAS